MRMPKTTSKRVIVALVCAVIGLGVVLTPRLASHAQNPGNHTTADNVVITLAVPSFIRDSITDQVLAQFEIDNPGVTVQVVTGDVLGAPSPANDIGAHLDAVQKLTSEADVVITLGNGLITPEATRAGYYLNLQPLVDSDSQLNQTDFVPQLFRAYQWDQGTWALPLAADATVLTYDPAAFDKAGLSYPDGTWTIDNMITALKALNVTDSQGNVVTSGIELTPGANDIPLYMSLIGKPLYDPASIPNPPALDQPEVRALFDRLRDFEKLLPLQVATPSTAPIRIESIQNLNVQLPDTPVRKGSLLPGGHVYLSVSAAAISSATQYPEQAYALAKYLTARPELNRFSVLPARVSLSGQSSNNTSGTFTIPLKPEVKQLLTQALANSYTETDRRFYEYLSAATVKMQTEGLDGPSAIADAQQTALTAEQTALNRRSDASKVAVVGTPVPTPDVHKGVTLKFGLTVYATSLPKKDEIKALADQFVKNTPGLAGITIENGFDSADVAAGKYDCFYLPYSAVPSLQLDSVLNLDPYLGADPNYNAQDFVGGALAQVQRDNKIWALPMGLSPTVMWYDPLAFANAGAPPPTFGWGVDSFKDALNSLKPFVKDGTPPFYMSGPGGEGVSLLMLIASYGGTPIDWSTSPPTIKFTDPVNAAAMRQVLDLAKAGLIDYKALGSNFGISFGSAQNNPLYSQQLNGLDFGQLALFGNNKSQDTSKLTAITFPKGPNRQALSYSESSLYISAKAQNPDLCYKWLNTFAQHPELMSLMPARQSQLNDSGLETSAGKALAAVYREVGQVLADSNTLKIPSLFDGGSNISGFIVQYWLFQAWDDYVLKGKDLDTGLQTAQQYATGYTECAAALPSFDPQQQKYTDYLRNYLNCATKADPRLKGLFGGS